jgi:hypothetical protein
MTQLVKHDPLVRPPFARQKTAIATIASRLYVENLNRVRTRYLRRTDVCFGLAAQGVRELPAAIDPCLGPYCRIGASVKYPQKVPYGVRLWYRV